MSIVAATSPTVWQLCFYGPYSKQSFQFVVTIIKSLFLPFDSCAKMIFLFSFVIHGILTIWKSRHSVLQGACCHCGWQEYFQQTNSVVQQYFGLTDSKSPAHFATLLVRRLCFVFNSKLSFLYVLTSQADGILSPQQQASPKRNTKCCRNFKVLSGFIYWLDNSNWQN